MERSAREIVDRLSPAGMTRVLDDLLDKRHLIHLANTCGLKYPGMRAQSQSRERLLTDLVERADKNDAALKAIVRMLTKETAKAQRSWTALAPNERADRLEDESYLLADGHLGLHLFLLARAADSEAVDARERLLGIASRSSNGKPPEPQAPRAATDESRLQKRLGTLDSKIRHLESQLAKEREAHRVLKRDLIQRKGELAESRMLVERLRAELTAAQTAASRAAADREGSGAGVETVTELAQAVRRLAAEQKALAKQIAKGRETLPRSAPDAELLVPVTLALQEVHKEITGGRRERKKQLDAQGAKLEELRAEIRSQRAAAASPPKRERAKGEANRVGVFVDVQNMYYGARQLRGKLDFDALLQAAVADRRLIQATAYVVESKDIDQSQFIARLQQRAIDVRRKPLQVRADGSMKGDWDMELALDILEAAPRLDVVVLVSGDGDFTSLVKRVKSMGPRFEVMAFPQITAKSLVEAADHFQALDDKFMIGAKTAKSAARKRPAPEPPAKAAAPAAADAETPPPRARSKGQEA